MDPSTTGLWDGWGKADAVLGLTLLHACGKHTGNRDQAQLGEKWG